MPSEVHRSHAGYKKLVVAATEMISNVLKQQAHLKDKGLTRFSEEGWYLKRYDDITLPSDFVIFLTHASGTLIARSWCRTFSWAICAHEV